MIAEPVDNRNTGASLTTIQRVLYFALPTLIIIGALIAYKSSAALGVISKVSATGALTPRGNVIPLVGAAGAGVLTRTLNYFLIIWPALFFGILISGAVAQWLPASGFTSPNAKLLAVIVVATFAIPLALPTFFEIPLAFVLLSSGAPIGAALALLIAGPAINLPSLLTIVRSTSWKVAALVAASVCILAVASGVFVSFL